MRKHCWVYYDLLNDQLVLVRRPHRRSVGGLNSVMTDHTLQNFPRAGFSNRFVYLGGLNVKPRFGKKAVFDIETRGLDFDPYESHIEQFECPWE